MTKAPVRILLAAGIVLTLVYIFVYFTESSSGTAGAFTAIPAAGHAIFALVIAVLAFVAIRQKETKKK